MDDQASAREASARAAVERLSEGMTIGLGSGRAVWLTIELIAERWPGGRPPIRAAFASEATRERAAAVGIDAVELDGEVRLELAIDGADEVDPQLALIKGGGAALLREKIVVTAAERFLVIAETRKKVDRLGGSGFKLPVEVVRFGWRDTRRRLLELVPSADLRIEGDAPKVTDEAHYLLDCTLPGTGDLSALGDALKATVGVVEHGLFIGLASEALLGTPEGDVEVLKP